MFQRIYDSAWHHPITAWVAGLLVLGALAAGVRRDRMRTIGALLAIATMLDATFTGALTPLPRGSALTSGLALLFVLLGDWRFFFLVERLRPAHGIYRAASERQAGVVAAALTLIVPLVTFGLGAIWPRLLADERLMFLVYETTFVPVALMVGWRRVLRLHGPGRVRRFLLGLVAFEVVQYGLWAIADVVILTAGDVGYLVRLVPNLMYYAAFVPFVVATAPPEERA